MSELKPCPFCGGRAELIEENKQTFLNYDISCTKCLFISGWSRCKESLIEAWNTRAYEEQEIKELREQLAALQAELERDAWVSVEDRLPEEDIVVDIYCCTHPEEFNSEYSAYKDGRDLTEANLEKRKYARKWYKENPLQKGSLYMTAFMGLKWRMRGLPTDSVYGFFGGDGIVTHWKPITPPQTEGE